jgi:hypothetical protein
VLHLGECETVPNQTADSWAIVYILTGGLLGLGICIRSLLVCQLPLRLWLRRYSVLGGIVGTVLVYAVRWPKYYRGARGRGKYMKGRTRTALM